DRAQHYCPILLPARIESKISSMKPFLLGLLLMTPVLQNQSTVSNLTPDFASMLNFEAQQTGKVPTGWGGGPPGTIFIDESIVHGGRRAVRLERGATSAQNFTTITKSLPADYSGKTIEWRGFLRTEDVSGFTGLWLREDGEAPTLEFDNMQRQQLNGTHD